MIVKEHGICPNCEHKIEEDSKFCQECGTQLECKEGEIYSQPKPEQNVMRKGNIKCDCGQEFYYETRKLVINCIKCGKEHSVV